nr:pyruvate:ferredoxin (flavodoxin) oxidoreductase [Spirochaetota bacterium]
MAKRIMKSMDGNEAAAYISYAFTEVAAIYPITPSSPMAEFIDEWAAHNKKNIFGQVVRVVEMQSEAGAAAAVHGSLQAGTLTTTYTASQGLLLMIPNMYKIAAELLPAVFHVSARSISAQALSIFGDHQDINAARQTGFAMLASGGVQEVMDLAGVAHLSAIKSRIPFLHFFDGFRTSHEIQKIEILSYEDLARLIDYNKLNEFKNNALNPEHPVTRGTAQNPDIYFQTREVSNIFYQTVPDIVEEYMQEISKLTGREYHPFIYYGAHDAEHIIVAMGSITETIRETIDYLLQQGEKVGLIICHLYRPFSTQYFFKVLPESVKRIAVLDRTKEPGSIGEPLYLDVRAAFYGMDNCPTIVGGRYGLSSKDTTPAHIIAVYNNLKLNDPKNNFTVGIVDDVTFTSLPVPEDTSVVPEGTFEGKFFGLGSDGTVGANKNSIKIIGDNTELYAQAYFAYDSKKSGGVTVSHLRFGKKPIRSTYLVNNPDFVACHVPAYLEKYDILKGLKKGGAFLLNSLWDEEETKKQLPDHIKRFLAENNIKLYIINATQISENIGLPGRTNTIMQAAFFKVSNVIPFEIAEKEMKKAIEKSYGRKGADVVSKNMAAVDEGAKQVKEVAVPDAWKTIAVPGKPVFEELPPFIQEIVIPMNSLEGDSLPVSAFLPRPDGTFPPGTTQYEKRGIAINVPEWQPDNCIQCNQCAYVCPHAVIRPFLLNDDEMRKAPEGMLTLDAKGKGLEGLRFRIQISPLDCTGCGNCAEECPAKEKALIMKPLQREIEQQKYWDFIVKNVTYKDNLINKFTVKGSQFCQPLFEFSGACAGCGETPYIKLITQLFGDRMMIANATGCSSIYGGSAPATPYCINAEGRGPAWASSLFEDASEYGYGMYLGVTQQQNTIAQLLEQVAKTTSNTQLKAASLEWLAGRNNAKASREATQKLLPLLKGDSSLEASEVLK